jgi:hypothetical protein
MSLRYPVPRRLLIRQVHHDELDNRAYDEATVITNELYIDIEDLLLGFRIQRPQLNSPKMKETSQHLIVLVGSTIVDSNLGEHIVDKPLPYFCSANH